MAEMSPSKALEITENPAKYTVQERKDAKKVLDAYAPVAGEGGKGSRGQKLSKGGDVTVVSIGVGKMKKKDAKKLTDGKTKMADGGMAYGKKHMYAAGGSVTMNPGLKALKAKSPEAFNKITGN